MRRPLKAGLALSSRDRKLQAILQQKRDAMPPGIKTEEEKTALKQLVSISDSMKQAGKLTIVSHDDRQAELDRTIARAQSIRSRAQSRLKGLST
jgi:hypothetical protein